MSTLRSLRRFSSTFGTLLHSPTSGTHACYRLGVRPTSNSPSTFYPIHKSTFWTSSATATVERHTTHPDPAIWVDSLGFRISGHSATVNPYSLVLSELDKVTEALLSTVQVLQMPVLNAAAAHLLSLRGKRTRPTIVILIAHAAATNSTSTILPSQRRLAEVTELIHAASLLHDDVVDGSSTRRGAPSANAAFGNQLAVLAGDFLLARASIALASLGDCDIVIRLSRVIEHLVRGEVLQMRATQSKIDTRPLVDGRKVDYEAPTNAFEAYLAKTFFKTASLIANSSCAVCKLGGADERVANAAFTYGEHIGMTFQLVDDVLDWTGDATALGKPVCNDLRQGHVTAPVLFAMQKFPNMKQVVERRDVQKTMEYVIEAGGIEKTKALAEQHATEAVRVLVEHMQPSLYRSALINLVHNVLTRQK